MQPASSQEDNNENGKNMPTFVFLRCDKFS